jgi:hypothetical protein
VLRRSRSPLAAAAQMPSGVVSCACREADAAMKKTNRLAMVLVNLLTRQRSLPTRLGQGERGNLP